MKTVTGHNGVRLHVYCAGDPANPAVLLIHGWSQSHQSWAKQMNGPLAQSHYLVALDLRGHGQSDKPDAPEAYDTSLPWAEDIQAVIDQLALDRPVLVGWSMGGKVVLDYLRIHGDVAIGGVVMVGTAVTSGKFNPPEAIELRKDPDVLALGMMGEDCAANVEATMRFVRACTADPLPSEDFARMVGFNMLCPPHIRKAARIRDEDYKPAAAATTVPALVIWGDQDRPIPRCLFDELVPSFPNAQATVFEGIGHAPFWEDADRFDRLLADFVQHCQERLAG